MLTMKPAILLVALSFAAQAADWPQFRGPTADGVTTDTNLPLTWSEKENRHATVRPGGGVKR